MPDKKPTIFLTGASGFFGSYLLKIFLENGHKVYALSRGKNQLDAHTRVLNALKFWDGSIKTGNLTTVEGDITKKNCGFNKKVSDTLRNEVDEIFHSAAITDLNTPIKEISRINVGGTRNILDLALDLRERGKLKKVNHISTAYVYGDYEGVFKETDLDKGQRFKTNYEKTKFEAELLVHEYRKKGVWIDIFRPPMIIGESKTGKTSQYRHIYQFLNLNKLELFETLPIKKGLVSIVPIDVTAKALYIIDCRSRARNMTYHPFPKTLNSIEEILNVGSALMKFKPPKAVELKDFNTLNFTPTQRMLLNGSVLSINFRTKLNSAKTNTILRKYNFRMPEINNKYLSRMLKSITHN